MSSDPIEDYLDRLFQTLPGTPRQVRRTLREAEEHLLDSAAAHEARGVGRLSAERAAIADFGAPSGLVPHMRLAPRDLLRPAVVLTGIGLVAIGVSGLLAEILGRLLGAAFVAGDISGTTYTPARCAELREYAAGQDCLGAADLHHWGEVVDYRIAAGLLGLVLLGLSRGMRRRRSIPQAWIAALGLASFGTAAVTTGLEGVDVASQHGGAGQWLSAAVVAAAVAVAYLLMLARASALPARPTEVAAGEVGPTDG